MNIKKLVSAFSALAIAGSAFAGLAVTANAADTTTTTYTFEDDNAVFTADSRITVAIEDNTELSSKVVSFTNANNAQNGYSFAHYDFSKLVAGATNTKIELDYYNNGDNGRAIMSLGSASVRGTTGGSSKQTYSNTGVAFNLGSDKNNAIVQGATQTKSDYTNKWLHVTVDIDELKDTLSYTITDKSTKKDIVSVENAAFLTTNCSAVTQIDIFSYINNNKCAMIDNLSITKIVSDITTHNITVNKVYQDGDSQVALSSTTEQVADGGTYTPEYDQTFNQDGYKYTYVSGGDALTNVTEDKTITIVYSRRALATTKVNINAVNSENTVLANLMPETEVVEDSSVGCYRPKYIFKDSVLYSSDKNSSGNYFYSSVKGTTKDQTSNVVYTTDATQNAYFYAEAENIDGLTAGDDNARLSGGKGAYAGADTVITALEPGKYKVEIADRCTTSNNDAGNKIMLAVGDTEIISHTIQGSVSVITSDEITVTSKTNLVMKQSGAAKYLMDYVLVRKTGDVSSLSVSLSDPVVKNGTGDCANTVASGYIATVANTGASESSISKMNVTVDNVTKTADTGAITINANSSVKFGLVLNNINVTDKTVAVTVE